MEVLIYSVGLFIYALFRMVRCGLLRPLRPELESQDEEMSSHEDKSELRSTKNQGVYIIRWDFNEVFLFHVVHRINLPLDGARIW
jgi:hypothetical protein